ncbi:MAG: hypothetical protein SNJ83_08360, partial [Aggregatilineales bacterium]
MRHRWLWAYGLLLVIALGSYVLLGWHVRMLADDYCTAYVALKRTVLESVIHDYYNWNWTYVDSFFKAVIARFQPAFHQVQTVLLLVALGAALWWLVREVGAALQVAALRRYSGLVALVLLMLVMYTIPSYSVLFWYSALLPYSFPIALIIAALAAVLRWVRHDYHHAGWYGAFWIFAAIFINGTANTFFLPLLGALALAAIYVMWRAPAERRRILLTVIAAVALATLVSFVLVFTAPGNAVRQTHEFAMNGFTTPSILELVTLTIQYTLSYLLVPYGYTLLYGLLGLVVGVFLTMAIGGEDAARIRRLPMSERWIWLDISSLIALSLGVAVATIIATSYGVGMLLGRTMFFPRVAQALCMVVLGYMFAVWLARRGFPSAEIKRRPAYRAVRLALIGL